MALTSPQCFSAWYAFLAVVGFCFCLFSSLHWRLQNTFVEDSDIDTSWFCGVFSGVVFFVSGLPRGRCFWSKQDVSRNRCEHEFAFNLFWKDFVFWPALTASKHFCGRQWYRHVMILWRFLWCWFLFLASLGGVVFDQNRMCQEIAVNTNSHLISIFQSNYHRCHFRSISECRAGLG